MHKKIQKKVEINDGEVATGCKGKKGRGMNEQSADRPIVRGETRERKM